jgi:two-component system, OmpR family, sensor kinase
MERPTGDTDLLELALRNVLDNAIKFTRPGDTVQVRAFEDRGWVIIEITDSGPGIPPDEQAQIWDELFRGKNARGTPGSGLGLALVQAVIEQHGGQAALRSQVDHGTRITLRLPAGL